MQINSITLNRIWIYFFIIFLSYHNKLNIEYDWDTFQKLQTKLPNDLKWHTVVADLHQNTAIDKAHHNVKYVSSCGHFEAVYRANGTLLSEKNCPEDMGTYNYSSPDKIPVISAISHTYYDVIPYYLNNHNVKHSSENAIKQTFDYYIGDNVNEAIIESQIYQGYVKFEEAIKNRLLEEVYNGYTH